MLASDDGASVACMQPPSASDPISTNANPDFGTTLPPSALRLRQLLPK
jgi:hypothetical protein